MLTALATFLAALLLFGVQPLLGKWLLPRHGGASAVWGMAVLFFQLALLAGYSLAHAVARRCSPRAAGFVYAALLGAGAVVLGVQQWAWGAPLLVPVGAERGGGWPGWSVLRELAWAAGIPIVAVASSSPFLLASRAAARPGASPYGLLALGNVGSLAALFAYPLVVEPQWPLATQARAWWVALVALALLAVAQAVRLPREKHERGPEADAIPLGRWVRWVLLAGAPVAYLTAMTGALTHELAPIPLLWVVPLAAYLIAWIVPFMPGRRSWPLASMAVALLGLLPISADLLSEQGYALGLVKVTAAIGWHRSTAMIGILLGVGSLFAAALGCHAELARDRPAPGGATTFTLAIAAGGALGGMAAALAPLAFDDAYELPLAFIAAAAGTLIVWRGAPAARRAVRLVLVAAMGLALAGPALRPRPDQVAVRRTFFGILRVRHIAAGTEYAAYQLSHGGVSHGLQFTTEPYRHLPSGYYHADSGLGRALEAHPRRRKGLPLRVGLVGLGAGTIAAYGRAGDVYRFYEIDTEVERLARRYFSYLDESAAAIEVVIGDGRMALEAELAAGRPGRFDLLVLDAFGGGAIPVHLLTREAAQVYRAHLAPGGVLAVHVSSVHVDLVPVAYGMAHDIGLRTITAFHSGDPPATYPTAWVIAAEDERWLRSAAFAGVSRPLLESPRVWTDQASNLFEALRR